MFTQADAPELIDLLNRLLSNEGDTLTLAADNADFDGHNSIVEAAHDFGPPRAFAGESVIQCLRDAVEARGA